MAISKEIRQKVYDMYNGHCAYCGYTYPVWLATHWQPIVLPKKEKL